MWLSCWRELTLFACVVVSILIQKFRHELVLPYLNRFLYLDLVLVALYLSQSWSVPIFIALLSYLLTPRPRLWPPHHDRSWVASLIQGLAHPQRVQGTIGFLWIPPHKSQDTCQFETCFATSSVTKVKSIFVLLRLLTNVGIGRVFTIFRFVVNRYSKSF